ncbi:unnamed protein product [Periconia digitata]|uniref:Cupredoxin n=1 Tax=Periconia digitata TaxID=1303443 RepID=A0A9W4UH96_9PLEO|nr:unnamed protein product [Periconia digitata]
MYFSRAAIASALVGFGAATTHSAEAAAAAATGAVPAGMVATHVVQVGSNGSLTFSPENLKANVGDLVQFQFHPKNHSVVQSTFDQPCVPIVNVQGVNATNAFFSGFMPTNASVTATSQVLTYTIRVMDTKPVWYYCSQGKHCQGGMVGSINAATSGNKTMSAFKALAAKAPANITPSQGSTGSGSGSSSNGTSSGTPSGSGSGAGGAGGAGGAAGGAGGSASGTAANSPAVQTNNPATSLQDKQSMFGLSVGVLAAFLVL